MRNLDLSIFSCKDQECEMPTIGFRMLRQEKTHWCWLAVTSAIANFYTPVSIWTQPKLMENFVRAPKYARRFLKIFNDPGNEGVSHSERKGKSLNFPGAVEDGLRMVQCFRERIQCPSEGVESDLKDRATELFGRIKAEIDKNHPVACGVRPKGSSGEGHAAVIVGYNGDVVIWKEPGKPDQERTSPSFYDFMVDMGGVGWLDYMILTKPPRDSANDPEFIFRTG